MNGDGKDFQNVININCDTYLLKQHNVRSLWVNLINCL